MAAIHFEFTTKTIGDILNMYEKRELDLSPGFQRRSVWRPRDRQNLIDSILHNYPLPSIFFHKKPESGDLMYYAIDGKQRLETILMFTGHIKRESFQVKVDLPDEEQAEGTKTVLDWQTLKRQQRQHLITGYKLQVVEVEADVADIIQIFVRINSTGKALTKAETAHAQYCNSEFMKMANQLSRRFESYFDKMGIMNRNQISRMKHLELVCDLIVSGHDGDVIAKRTVLDSVMKRDALVGKKLEKAAQIMVKSLNTTRRMFPSLRSTRFSQLSDFYTLCVMIQKLERDGYILTDTKRNDLAFDLLSNFGQGVDQVSDDLRNRRELKPEQELYRSYLDTVQSGTDKLPNRQKRQQILINLLATLFEFKDSARLFTLEQRRIIWNSTAERICSFPSCGTKLTWEDFTIDHIEPYSKGGRTALENAALMCRVHNSSKGNKRRSHSGGQEIPTLLT